MRKIVLSLLIVFLVSLNIFSDNEPNPPDMKELKKNIINTLESIFEDSDQTSYGFEEDDKIENITLSRPFKFHILRDDMGDYVYKKGDDIKKITKDAFCWQVIVLCNQEPRALVTAWMHKGEWRVAELRGFDGNMLYDLVNKYNEKELYLIDGVYQGKFYHFPEIDNTNLTEISFEKEDTGLSKSTSHQLEDVDEGHSTVQKIKERIHK